MLWCHPSVTVPMSYTFFKITKTTWPIKAKISCWASMRRIWQLVTWPRWSQHPYIFFLFIIAPAYSKVRYRGSTFRPFVLLFVRPSVRPQFMSRCLLCSSDSWEYETLHSIFPWHTLQEGTLTQCPWPWFHAPLTLSKFCVESRKFTSSLEIKFISLQQC